MTDAQLSMLRVERGIHKRAITNLEKKVQETPDLTAVSANTLISTISTTMEKFTSVQIRIEVIVDGNAELLAQEQKEGDSFDTRCTELQLKLATIAQNATPTGDKLSMAMSSQTDILKKLIDLQEGQSSHPEQRTKLPQLGLPTFDGKYTDWPEFRDAFTSSIHNNKCLKPHEKMQYLKMSLSGSAAEDVSHIPISDNTYATTWERLKAHYDKKAHLVNAYIHQFITETFKKVNNALELKAACRKYRKILDGLAAIGPECLSLDMWLIYLMKSNMNEKFRIKWEEGRSADTLSKTDEFFVCMNAVTDVMERATQDVETATVKEHKAAPKPTKQGFKTHHTNATECPECKSNHPLYACDKFKALSFADRRDRMSLYHLCYNCLRPNHSARNCSSQSRCQKCGKRHHTVLHPPQIDHPEGAALPVQSSASMPQHASAPAQQQNTSQQTATTTESFITHHSAVHRALLPTAIVNVKDAQGEYQTCRVLIDGGGECTMISEDCAQRLALPRAKAKIAVYGAGEVLVGHSKGLVHLEVSSRYDPNNKIHVNAYVMNKVTSNLPSTELSSYQWQHLLQLQLADPQYKVPGKIDIILGVEYASYINLPQIVKGNEGEPVAQLTIFGWTVSGSVNGTATRYTSHHMTYENFDLKQFWEFEENYLDNQPLLTEEEALCEDNFTQTHFRDDTGRYVVKLPFKKDHPPLGNSSTTALARFQSLERRLAKDPNLREQYVAFMDEYIKLNHMEPVVEDCHPPDHLCYYLPHQAVLRPSSETTKLRVVFDASATTRPFKPSLNDVLATGPTLQRDLISLLLFFRIHKIALAADAEKMYRQIVMALEDRNFQRIFWRSDPQQELQIHWLNTVTYGTSCASFLAVRVLIQIAEDYKDMFPEACEAIKSSFYMDDLLCGAASIEEGKKLQKDIQEVLAKGHLILRKWASNSCEVLEDIAPAMRAITPEEVKSHTKSITALGLKWSPGEDNFALLLEALPSATTKRDLCAAAAKIFDPLGFIAPLVIKLKIMFQALWVTGIDWNDNLPQEVAAAYKFIANEFHLLSRIRIPRLIPSAIQRMELHGFADASMRAFGAVIYAKGIDGVGNTVIEIVMAKSRVAPLKPVTIPRMELKAAGLLADLITKVQSAIPNKVIQIHAWSDSTTVLHWLREPPLSWKPYVARRVHEIQEAIPPVHWRYVPTTQNPADCISRGIYPREFMDHPLWWHGPNWLSGEEDKWPINKAIGITDEERASKAISLVTRPIAERPFLDQLIINMSGYFRIVLRVTYLRRYMQNIQCSIAGVPKQNRLKGYPRVSELHNTAMFILKYIQMLHFPDEYRRCSQGKDLAKTSRLRTLAPFLDKNGLMRTRGRLGHTKYDYGTKHPIILPSNHKFVKDLVIHIHEINLHTGQDVLFNTLRARYWIIGGRVLAKNVAKSCVKCIKTHPRTLTPFMGDLPECRVEEYFPFLKVGCDFAGPIKIRASKLRKAQILKAYICVFICMSTKMMHLEAVGDLSTELFIGALERFKGLRPWCKQIYCDNGSNFVGASGTSREDRLKGVQKHQYTVGTKMAAKGIDFHFIPAHSPTFGGLWERGVANVKMHLRRVVGESLLTFEELQTVLAQIGLILNSRPLCAKTTDLDDMEALTPGHFMYFFAPNIQSDPSEPCLLNTNPNRLTRLQNCKRMVQHFWQRWHQEYVTSLQHRPKWYKKRRNLQVGDLVLLREAQLKPSFWKMGRILEVYPGKDEVVRVILVKTQDGIEKRAVNTVALLLTPTEPDIEPLEDSTGGLCGNFAPMVSAEESQES